MAVSRLAAALLLAVGLAVQGGCSGDITKYKKSQTELARDWERIEARQWRLVSLDGSSPIAGTEIVLFFGPGKTFSGNAGVNTYSGNLERTAYEQIVLSPTLMTSDSKTEPAGAMKQEAEYLKLLTEVDAYKFFTDGNRLDLERNGRTILEFSASPRP